MKWAWAFLFLAAVILGSLWVWRGFGQGDAFLFKRRANSYDALGIQKPEGKGLAVFGAAPDFSLTERSGETFSKGDLAGRPWITDFIFTRCAGQCPLMNLQMRKFQAELGPETGFRFVSFSVDPEWDTADVLSDYADRYEAEKDRWFFLTGEKQDTNRILSGFFLSQVEQPSMHSVRFILVDGAGEIRGYYDSSDPGSMAQLLHDAKILAASP